ncbi:MAG: PAC2 family protein [Anaerolineae bacterium]|nr:PAC2 family protein [Anaerolineae bacterium]
MDELVELWETPTSQEIVMIAGWHQWADAGSISSGLPDYVIDKMKARKIGEIDPDGFYVFQVPGGHHLFRPRVKFEEGYRLLMEQEANEFFWAGDRNKGVIIFLGQEPHLNVRRYAEAFLDAVEALRAKRVIILGGVYGALPYDKDRDVSCIYSLPEMKEELERYAVRFSNYEGGATIGSYIVDRAEMRGVEVAALNGFVPAYDFAAISSVIPGIRIENDFKAWYDLMNRINFMFHLDFDLTELEQHCQELLASMEAQIEELENQAPQLKVREYLDELTQDFVENPFVPLDDVWREGLEDIFRGLDDWK